MRSAATVSFLLGLALSAPALAGAGAELAASIEEAKDRDARQAALAKVGELDAKAQEEFVAWARRQRTRGEGWRHLAPALQTIGSRSAAKELGAVALSSLEEAPLALQALLKLPAKNAWAFLTPGLVAKSRRTRARVARALGEGLTKDPSRLRALSSALDLTPRDDPQRQELELASRQIVAEALAATEKPEKFVFEAPLIREPLALGLAEGVHLRLKQERAAAARDQADKAEQNQARRRFDPLPLLEALSQREEPALRAEAFRLLPEALDELNDTWAEALFAGLDDKDKRVKDWSWRALRRLTSAQLPQVRAAWEAWWEGNRGS